MKESEKWLAICDQDCPFKRHFPNCVCCDIALEYKKCKSEEQADKEGEGMKDYPPYLDYPKERKPQTNYDLLISKTPEELAEFLTEYRCVHKAPHCMEVNCTQCWLDWLKSPVEEQE